MTANKKTLLSGFILFISSLIYGQQPVHFGNEAFNKRANGQCAHTSIHEGLISQNPKYRQEQETRESNLSLLIAQQSAGLIPKSDAILTIPVVVHIVHTGQPYGVGANITDEQVYSAINALNDDFRKIPGTWGDGNGVDVKVDFCLAQRDPSGNGHSGINRVNGCSAALYCDQGITAGNGQGANELNVKDLSRWPNQQYYNIWVVTEIENNNGGSGIQGYAYFPTSSAVDGTVILFNAFGTVGTLKTYTNRNKTLTHEMGHAFALFHTFQGDSCNETDCDLMGDRVCDTPPTTLNSNCNTSACGGTQQVENYLDYTSQTCKNMFTLGQKDRMRLSITNSRPNLMNSNGCQPVGGGILADAAITAISKPFGNVCSNIVQSEATLTNSGSTILTSATIQYRTSGAWQNHQWTGILGQNQSANIILPTYNGGWGIQTMQVQVVNPNGGSDSNDANNLMSRQYTALQNGHTLNLSITIDNLGAQNTWEVRNNSGQVLAFGGPYSNFQSGVVHTAQICIADGCYDFVMMDSGSNGMCCFNGNGSYTLTHSNGTVLALGGTFTTQQLTNFCVSNGTPPQANFTAANNNICMGQGVAFTNQTTAAATSYLWTFTGGSPATSTQANPGNVVYNNTGSYTVKLKAANQYGFTEETKTDYVIVAANTNWYEDQDGDGYGNPAGVQSFCIQPTGYVSNAMDCNDTNINDWYSCYDCAGEMNGPAYTDACGVCDAIAENDCEPCETLSASILAIGNPTCYGEANGEISLSINSLTGNYNVVWSNGLTGASINGLTAGNYSAQISDNECTITVYVTLTEPNALTIIFKNIVHVACGASNTGAASFTITGGTEPYTAQYNDLTLSQNYFTSLAPDLYVVDVADANECQIAGTLQILQLSCDSLANTQLSGAFCGSENTEFAQIINCTAVANAEQYEWKFAAQGLDSQVYTTASNSFTPYLIPFLIPNTLYQIQVRGLNDTMSSAFGSECDIIFRIGSTQLSAETCGEHNLTFSTSNFCIPIIYAEKYEFRLENNTTGERFYYESNDGQFVPSSIPGIEADVIYKVTVQVNYKNIWGSVGAICTIMIHEVIETTILTENWCNNHEIILENDTLEVQPINSAGVYELLISGGDITGTTVLQNTIPRFAANDIEGLSEGHVYLVRARALIGSSWLPWGPSCSIALQETEVQELNLLIYPNPATSTGEVYLLMSGNWNGLDLCIQSITGVKLHCAQLNVEHNTPKPIEIPTLRPGLYLVTLTHGAEVLSKKMIIQ